MIVELKLKTTRNRWIEFETETWNHLELTY